MMAAQDVTRNAPFGAVAIHTAVSKLETQWIALKTWNTRRKTVAALSALSDHELADIGMHRSELSEMAARFSTQA